MPRSLLFLCLLAVCGCSQDDTTHNISVSGIVATYDVMGHEKTNHLGVEVALDGTTYKTTTNSDGTWTISGISAATYSITFTKAGYNGSKIPQIDLGESNSNVGFVAVHETPWFTLHFDADMTYDSQYGSILKIDGEMPHALSTLDYYTVMLFAGTTPNVSKEPQSYFDYFYLSNHSAITDSVHYSFSYQVHLLSPLPDTIGTHYYFIAYGATTGPNPYYTDFPTGDRHFTNLSPVPSEVVDVVLK